MLNKIFARQPRLEHADSAQRLLGLAELAPESDDIARLMAADAAPEVRAAAALRCVDADAIAAALATEADPAVRAALDEAFVSALAQIADDDKAKALLEADATTDAARAQLAHCASSATRRRMAINTLREEDRLVEVALGAELAETRMAAAERVHSRAALQRIAEAAKNKDHGVFRLARQRLDSLKSRAAQETEADAVLSQLESLAAEPGPILTAVVELNRRWQVLDMTSDAARLVRCDTARQLIQSRFEREQEEQREKAQYERRLREWIAALRATVPLSSAALAELRTALAALRDEAQSRADAPGLGRLDEAEQQIARWEAERQALAGAEALVVEAEMLAADTSIDNALLPARWQALNRATRTPELTRRFEAALMTIEQRRLAQMQVTQQEVSAVRLNLHSLLHTAEQALAAGQLQAARAAAEEIRGVKAGAGTLPKPSTQRLSRVIQQLSELERWESFGQQNARMQLCERAEALATQTDPAQLAQDVQKLRNEWKALDQQNAGVPRSLWERFDRACEKAYAPAARHFAEQAAQRRDAKKRREEFIDLAAVHAPTLLGEVPDWRAVERWLRETDQTWREGELGSVDPGTWKKLDAKLKAAVAPARDALASARDKAKAGRQALIAEVTALGAKAMDRDAPSQVKAIQARWQEQAKALSLPPRDERATWDQFRAACDAVFSARQSKRKEEDAHKTEHRRALDDLCARLEQLSRVADGKENELRRALRELDEQWKKLAGGFDPALREVEGRFKRARTAVEGMLSARSRSRESAVWQTLIARDQLCEELEQGVLAGTGADPSLAAGIPERWAGLPELAANLEKPMVARRAAALRALADGAAAAVAATIARNAGPRRELLLELELLLGLDSPPSMQALRLALQVRQLKERFKSAPATGMQTAGDRLLAWCALAGIADLEDRQRTIRIIGKMGSQRT
ncbi:MAG: DUF349 domain-containing protein [Casimicrobiaceae bacterium]